MTGKCKLVVALLVILACCIEADAKPNALYPIAVFEAKVERIKDGDTVDVRAQDGTIHCIRIAEIDAPEKSQRYGAEATEALRAMLIKAGKIEIVHYKNDHKLCKYGPRRIAVLRIDGVSVAEAMVQGGHAWYNKTYAREWPRVWDLKLTSLEEEARVARRGLWADPGAIEPAKFRHGGE